jgi:hypothetical protein
MSLIHYSQKIKNFHMRYFFISYTFSDKKGFGFNNCTFKSIKYPSMKELLNSLSDNKHETIIITNILELNESDFKDLTNKD